MANTIVQRHSSQLASITKLSEKMRREYYTTNIEKMMTGSQINSDQESLLLFRSNDQYMEYLKDWYFTKFLIDAYRVPLAEIVSKNNITISIKNPKYMGLENWVNKRIEDSRLKEEIEDSLSDIIYYGRFFRILVKSATNDKSFKLAKIKDETGVTFAYQMNDHIGYIIDPGSDSNFLIRSKAVGSAYMYRDNQYKSLEEIEPQILNEIKKTMKIDDLPKGLLNQMVGLETKTPTSTFYSQAGLMFKMYLNELLIEFAQLRDTFKQNLLAITVDGTQKNTTEASKVVDAIESVVNQDSNVLYNQSVSALINQVISKIMNDTRVLPMVAEYSNANMIKWNDRSEDIQRLINEYDTLKTQILAALGIPDELMGVTSNRWEILSKSDRYLNTISSYVDVLTDIVKTFAQSVLLARGFEVSKEDIVFSYKTDTEIQAQLSQHKLTNLDQGLAQMNNIVNNFKVLLGSGIFSADKAVDELINQFQSDSLFMSKSMATKQEIMTYLMGGE